MLFTTSLSLVLGSASLAVASSYSHHSSPLLVRDLGLISSLNSSNIITIEKRGLLSNTLCGIGIVSQCSQTIDTQSSIANCGSLGNVCPSSFANGVGSISCSAGTCRPSSCKTGFAFSAGSGGCINTQIDPNNCGGVGMVCSIANASAKCSAGTCSIDQCDTGAYLIGSNCTPLDLKTDPQNCGKVGNVCDVSGAATSSCNAGSCQAVTCSKGYNFASGACNPVDTRTDVNNCGAVGRSCPTSYSNGVGSTVCQGGVCQPSSCSVGYNFDTSISSCRSVITDPKNCGSIGAVCNALGTVSGCSGGKCTVASCTSPYKLVNGVCTTSQASQRARAKRDLTAINAAKVKLCPGREMACPISGSESFFLAERTGFHAFRAPDHHGLRALGGYECLDTTEAIESCGGCASMGEGINCLDIPHASGVGCSSGMCNVFSCDVGYKPNFDGTGCVKLAYSARDRRSHGSHAKRALLSPSSHHHSHTFHRH